MPRHHPIARFQARHDAALQTMLRKAELAACIERRVPVQGELRTAIARLTLLRLNRGEHPVSTVRGPAMCMLAQGSKRIVLGNEAHVQDPDTYLVVSRHLPVSAQVIDATPELPHLALRLDCDPSDIGALLAGMRGDRRPSSHAGPRDVVSAAVTPALLDAVLRLVRLLDTPEHIEVLAPLTIREILYRLLTGPCCQQLATCAAMESANRSRLQHRGATPTTTW